MPSITVKSKRRIELINISSEIGALVPSDMREGICHVFTRHTTAGITVNENADPDVCSDLLNFLNELVPHQKSCYLHCEGNSDAHIKSSLMGVSQSIPIRDGRLYLGTWQGIYFCEFDGPRVRKVEITFLE